MALSLLSSSHVLADIKNTREDFRQGNEFYRQGDYTKAAETYESILSRQQESAAVYYNLANSYFKLGHMGKAVLNYERAKRLTPRDSDVAFNYQYALSQSGVSKEEAKSLFKRVLSDFINFYSLDEMLFVLTLAMVFISAFHLLSLFFKWSQRLRRGGIIFFASIIFVFSGGVVYKVQIEKNSAVILENISALFEPRDEATVHFTLSKGSKVKVIKHENDWVKIKRPDGKLGWIMKNKLESI